MQQLPMQRWQRTGVQHCAHALRPHRMRAVAQGGAMPPRRHPCHKVRALAYPARRELAVCKQRHHQRGRLCRAAQRKQARLGCGLGGELVEERELEALRIRRGCPLAFGGRWKLCGFLHARRSFVSRCGS